MLIFRNTSPIQGIYHHNKQNYILEASLFPKELNAVQTPEQFMGLLENAHITMQKDSKNPKKSTFIINQGCKGGMTELMPLLGLIIHVRAHTYIISQTFILSAKLLRMMDMGVEMPGENTKQGFGIKTMLGGGMITGGGVALAMGFPATWSAVALVSGLTLIMARDSESMQVTANRLEKIGYKIPQILDHMRLALDLIETSQKKGYCNVF